jgi:hypothetical protein
MGGVCSWVDDPIPCMKAQIVRLREALEEVQAEILLTGHLAEIVETAIHG